ncbi:MAG: hypothetical protein LBN39_09280 [Planctomycetaceae bacterium]|jgi:hypothetical protein|nr:hypothetical protein [Planctomycetaceae bacterium]
MSTAEETIKQHLDETRQLVRKVDLSLAVLTLVSVLFGLTFPAVLADQWFFTGGLPGITRFAVFAVLVLTGALFTRRCIVPLFVKSINPAYAANLLEENAPFLKNSLINWVLLRREQPAGDKLTERILDGVARTAANGAAQIPSEQAVDLRGLALRGIILAVLALFFILYAAFSPKDPLTSLARIVLPWGKIAPPQAVQFKDIKPGSATVRQGEHLTVSAEVIANRKLETPVYVVFSTSDGQAVEQRVPMTASQEQNVLRFSVPFPPGKEGFTSSIDYYLRQEDSISRPFHLDVKPVASLEIVSLKYTYPAYTGLKEETVENQSDIRAVEGTTVDVRVRSTMPVQRIEMLFDDAPKQPIVMKISEDGTEAVAELTLSSDKNRQTPTTVRRFSFRAIDKDNFESRHSGVCQMEVLPDAEPLIQWADTDAKLKEAAHLDLPVNGSLDLPIQAEDPDFALRYIQFCVESGNKRILPVDLLDSPATGPTQHKGAVNVKTAFSPAKSKLSEGDTAEIWAKAVDTKFPDPNVSETRKITVRITAPQNEEQNQGEQPENQDKQNQEKQDKGEQGQNQENKEQDNQQEDGDKEQEKQNEQNQNSEKQEGNKQQNGEQQKDSQQGDGQQQNGENSERQEDKQDGNSGGGSDGQQNGEQNQDGQQHGSGQQQSGEENKDAQPQDSGQQGGSQQGSGEKQQPVNPDTNPGDAMEKIAGQMEKEKQQSGNGEKSEGQQEQSGEQGQQKQSGAGEKQKSEEQPVDKNDQSPRERDDSLDPNSQQQRNEGGDASEPKNSAGNEKSDANPDSSGGNEKSDTSPDSSAGNEKSDANPDSSGRNEKSDANPDSSAGNEKSDANPDSSAGNEKSDGSNPGQTGSTGGGTGSSIETKTEDANLEYTEKVTNLVLEYLEEQLKDKPSKELLDKLGWTKEDLQKFYDRWKAMQKENEQQDSQNPARQGDDEKWKEALKSLGLRPARSKETVQQSKVKDDEANATESRRYAPPKALEKRFQQYTEGISGK